MSSWLARVAAVGLATVQDGGRHGYESVGVPTSGAIHQERYLVATALLAGAPAARCPAIELLAGELCLEAQADLVVAVVGPSSVLVDDVATAGGTAVLVAAGSRLVAHGLGRGPVYVVIGGWRPELTLGSASTDTFSRLGAGLLRAGQSIEGEPGTVGRARVGAFHRPLMPPSGPVRVVTAGHPGLADFTATSWTVASTARSGIRLRGASITASAAIASIPVLPGVIQLPAGGEPIVLGPDGGLTGGYPAVAVVASVDLDRLSLLSPGDAVSFREIDCAQAAMAWRASRRRLRAAVAHPRDLP